MWCGCLAKSATFGKGSYIIWRSFQNTRRRFLKRKWGFASTVRSVRSYSWLWGDWRTCTTWAWICRTILSYLRISCCMCWVWRSADDLGATPLSQRSWIGLFSEESMLKCILSIVWSEWTSRERLAVCRACRSDWFWWRWRNRASGFLWQLCR